MKLGLSLGIALKAAMRSNIFPKSIYMLYSQMCTLIVTEEIAWRVGDGRPKQGRLVKWTKIYQCRNK